jgi:hypothetical protein
MDLFYGRKRVARYAIHSATLPKGDFCRSLGSAGGAVIAATMPLERSN